MKPVYVYLIIFLFFLTGTLFLLIGISVEEDERQQLSLLLREEQAEGFFSSMFLQGNIGQQIINFVMGRDDKIEIHLLKYFIDMLNIQTDFSRHFAELDDEDYEIMRVYSIDDIFSVDELKQKIETQLKQFNSLLNNYGNKNKEFSVIISEQQNRIYELTEKINALEDRDLVANDINNNDDFLSDLNIRQGVSRINEIDGISEDDVIQQVQVRIPAGEFIMGPPENQRVVYLDEFYIDKYAVTNYMYSQFNENFNYNPAQANYPVTNITFYDAVRYAESRGMRLPTEEEWEKAARGTEGLIFPWGNEWNYDIVNTIHNSKFILYPVDSFPEGVSPYGLFNMSGNVFEWTSTLYEEGYAITKGGSFLNPKDFSKTYFNSYENKNLRFSALGFRCVRVGD